MAIENDTTGEIVVAGLPSLEAADGLTGGMEAVYSRLPILLEQAIRAPQRSAPRLRCEPHSATGAHVGRFAARGLARSAARLLYHTACYSPHWRIGWRFNDGPGVMERGALDGPRWNVLADRGHDCYADPFPIAWRGRTCVFFESLDHRVGKGLIGVVEFGPGGPIGEATTVIEEPWHLSYPFLIEAEGELWMIPESSTAGQVPLYRCVEFPYRWERRDPLLEGIEAADATIFAHDGRYYMTSVVREGLGGYSDTLAIHHAPRLFGPWREHAMRPTLVDASAARPAGAVIERSGVLWRPVQDCSQRIRAGRFVWRGSTGSIPSISSRHLRHKSDQGRFGRAAGFTPSIAPVDWRRSTAWPSRQSFRSCVDWSQIASSRALAALALAGSGAASQRIDANPPRERRDGYAPRH